LLLIHPKRQMIADYRPREASLDALFLKNNQSFHRPLGAGPITGLTRASGTIAQIFGQIC